MIASDLTFNELKIALVANNIPDAAICIIYGKLIIDVGAVLGSGCTSLRQKGVIEFVAKLLDAAMQAQAAANQKKLTGEQLAAFSSELSLNSQFAITAIVFKTQHEVSSAIKIIGGGIGLPSPIISSNPEADLLVIGVL